MLPDYLPIIRYNRLQILDTVQRGLFDGLKHQLSRQGIQVAEIDFPNEKDGKALLLKAAIGNDLILVNGYDNPVYPDLWIGERTASCQIEKMGDPTFLCKGKKDVDYICESMHQWLNQCLERTPVCGCVLIGGKSSRMGQPKHLLEAEDGRTWLEHSIDILSQTVSRVVVSGTGSLPESLSSLQRVRDYPDVSGPLAGIAAVVNSHPPVSWIVLACDMPDVTVESIRWIMSQRSPGRLAVIPENPLTGRGEPLFGWYDYRSATLIDKMISEGKSRMNDLRDYEQVYKPAIPVDLVPAWKNVNRPEELPKRS